MFLRILGIIAAALLLAYLAPVVVKLRDPALTVVAVVGIALMLIDLWQSLRTGGEGREGQ